jgi:hypothetical protein
MWAELCHAQIGYQSDGTSQRLSDAMIRRKVGDGGLLVEESVRLLGTAGELGMH